ncbi:RHS repeat-associated protein [Frondihabitans sp. PhB188]|uniref:RHS repeat-associated core domain-containing protein n=1 Tax=Frondihabitans sp. PhB188 TaxID=2485200 RepID=UPI000FB41FEA|nr:RHS repeat-associated core domain-containing protein [Frondihabitans sp. PhB188]ROQ30280.1 RHS repeat-associated protein [Frondihabitans sp. PhB188]
MFTPPSSADQHAIPAANAPTTPWAPQTPVNATGSGTKKSAAVAQPLSAPSGTTAAAPGLGSLPYFAFDKDDLSPDLVAQVNLANGNLLLTASDGSLSGPGLDLRNDRFYNGLSTAAGSYGGGWSSTLSQVDFGLRVSGTTAAFNGPTGITPKFTKSGTTWTAPTGFNATLTENDASTTAMYVLQYNQGGEKLSFSSNGYITSDTDRNGTGNHYAYNSSNQVSTITNAAGRQFTVSWSGNTPSLITHVDDSAGRDWQYDSNSAGQLSRVTKPGNVIENYTYDSSGRIATAQVSGAQGGDELITFGYDTSSRITSIKVALASSPSTLVSSRTYTYGSLSATMTDGNNHTTTYALNAAGNELSATDALGQKHSAGYDTNDNVTSTTDALGGSPGNQTTAKYDSLNNQTSVNIPTGAGSTASYSSSSSCTTTQTGNVNLPKCSTDAANDKQAFTYDTAGNMTSEKDSTSGGTGVTPVTKTYEDSTGSICGGVAGQVCTATNGNAGVTHYTYDSNGNLTQVTPPSSIGQVQYLNYDSLGRLLTVKDNKGQTTTYTYTVRDQLSQTTYQDGSTVQVSYYANGLPQTTTDSTQQTPETLTYDAIGRTLSQTGPGTASESYTYDEVGNVLSYTDTSGTVNYTYNGDNTLHSTTEPGGSCPASGVPAANSGCIQYTYNANGFELTRTFPGGAKITTKPDASGRPISIVATDSTNAVKDSLSYSYTVAGGSGLTADRTQIQSMTSTAITGVTAGAVTSYTYDTLGRLKSAVEKSGSTQTASWAYAYDADGNRTSEIRSGSTGATAGTVTYKYNAGDEITSTSADTGTWAYDANGDQTTDGITGQAQAPNDRDAISSIGSESLTDFAQGNSSQLSRSTPSSSYTGSALGLSTETQGSATTAYTRAPSGDLISERTGSGTYYYVKDALGSVIGLFSSTGSYTGGYSYSPYGELRASTTNGTAANNAVVAANPLRYIGGYFDSGSSLYKLGARYYDPTVGRFTQVDPSGQSQNQYLYASDDPINGSDSSGAVTSYGGEFCDIICVGYNQNVAADGQQGGTITLGLGGEEGASYHVSRDSEEEDPYGIGSGASCTSADGPLGVFGEIATATYPQGGEGSEGFGASYGAEEGCGVEADFSRVF